MKPTFKCALYLPQEISPRQNTELEDLREWVHRNGFAIAGKYYDYPFDPSGSEKPGLAHVMADAKAGMFDIVILESTEVFTKSDFASGLDALTRLVALCITVGVPVFSISQGQLRAYDLGSWIAKAQQRRKAFQEGQHLAAAPYGYQRKENNGTAIALAAFAPEATTVKRVFSEFAEGRSAKDLVDDLNAEGIRPRKGTSWRPRNLTGVEHTTRGILRNPVYIGEPVFFSQAAIAMPRSKHRDELNITVSILEKHWIRTHKPELQLVSNDIWQRAQDKLDRSTHRSKDRAKRAKRPLYGKIKCGLCNADMKMLRGDRYHCPDALKGSCTHTTGYVASLAERDCLRELGEILKTWSSETAQQSDVARLQAELKDAVNKREASPKGDAGYNLLREWVETVQVWPSRTLTNDRQITLIPIRRLRRE